jgi:NADH-quinone oxidoreductase subunit G
MSQVTITVDGVRYAVEEGKNLLEVCLSLGMDLPYFCWHPAMGSVGCCRQCAVRIYKDEFGSESWIDMACMVPVTDGLRCSVEDPEASALRTRIIELMMVSHPHDCPICDEGGECHLQDMTVMTGHVYRKYRFGKRTFRNQDLGPFVTHEMNRCIQCYRCLRFYKDYAGGHDFGAFALRHHVYFGRAHDGPLESEFSGNLVEVCPVGVFDDKPFAGRYTRKWDLQGAPAVCVHCGRGCTTVPGERYGELRRIRNRFNDQVNGYFLCDRGRYGFGFVNTEHRLRAARLRGPIGLGAKDDTVVDRLTRLFAAGQTVIGIGSPRASVEANYALRSLVGQQNYYLGMADDERDLLDQCLSTLQDGPAATPALPDLEAADACVILGEDLTNTAPMLAFALRRWQRLRPTTEEERLHITRWNDAGVGMVKAHEPSVLWSATTQATKLDEIAAEAVYAVPADLARLGFAVAARLAGAAWPDDQIPAQHRGWVENVAAALGGAQRPHIVCGPSCGSADLLRAAAALSAATPQPAMLTLTMPEVNSMGAVMLGGGRLPEAFSAASHGKIAGAIVLENDLYRRAPAKQVDQFLAGAGFSVVLDHLATKTVLGARAALPAATFAEATGTYVSHEGRAQRSYAVMEPPAGVRESWRWLATLAAEAGRPGGSWEALDDVLAALAAELPGFAPLLEAAPPAGFRIDGMKIPRQPKRYSGRTAMHAPHPLLEPKPADDADSALAFSMEGYEEQPPAALTADFWAPRWNSIQALNKFQDEVGGPLRGGEMGRRLLQPSGGAAAAPVGPSDAPPAHSVRPGEWLVVPLHHAFGSEELSALAPPVAELVPEPYLALCEADAQSLGEHSGRVRVRSADWTLDLALRVLPSLPRGVAGLAVGLPGMPALTLPLSAGVTLVVSGPGAPAQGASQEAGDA